MKPSAATLFAEDSRHSFQNQSGFIITVKDAISAFLCWDGKTKLPHISMQVTLPATRLKEIVLPFPYVLAKKYLFQHPAAPALSFSTAVKKIPADIDEF